MRAKQRGAENPRSSGFSMRESHNEDKRLLKLTLMEIDARNVDIDDKQGKTDGCGKTWL